MALSEDLRQLSRSQARGGIQPYRALPGGAEAAAAGAASRQLAGPQALQEPADGWEAEEQTLLLPGPGVVANAPAAAPAPGPWGVGGPLAMRTRSGRLSAKVGGGTTRVPLWC
jgi:hypothetical protein